MAITVLPKQGSFGGTLGTGIGEALQQLASQKVQQVQQQRTSSALQALLGLSPEQAQHAPYAPQSVLQEFAKQKLQEPRNQSYLKLLEKQFGGGEQGAGESETSGGGLNFSDIAGAGIAPKEATDLLKFGAEQKYKKEKLEAASSKDYREFSKPYIEKRKKHEANIRDYDTLIKIAPKLRAGTKQILLEKIGAGDIYRPNANEIGQKLMGRLAQNVSGVFGSNSRVTNYLESVFQRSLPGLWNTPDGIIAISKINKLTDEVGIEEDNIRKKLGKKYKYKLPPDFEDQIAEELKPAREKAEQQSIDLAEQFVSKNDKPAVGQKVKGLPDPSNTPVGAEGIWNGKKVRNTGKKWEEIK